jgi:hypothetical protein
LARAEPDGLTRAQPLLDAETNVLGGRERDSDSVRENRRAASESLRRETVRLGEKETERERLRESERETDRERERERERLRAVRTRQPLPPSLSFRVPPSPSPARGSLRLCPLAAARSSEGPAVTVTEVSADASVKESDSGVRRSKYKAVDYQQNVALARET